MKLPIRLLAAAALLLGVSATRADDPAPAIPATPAGVSEVVYVRGFELAQGYPFEWRREQPLLTTGTILVLRADAALAYVRQGYNPVLYVGDSTAERVNVGYRSGMVVAVVPGVVDPATTPIWFGTPDVLPEQVDAAKIAKERALAAAAGIGPRPVSAPVAEGVLKLASRDALQPVLGRLVEQFAKDEADLAAQLLTLGGNQ